MVAELKGYFVARVIRERFSTLGVYATFHRTLEVSLLTQSLFAATMVLADYTLATASATCSGD